MWLTLDDAAAASSSSRSLLVTDLERTRPPPLSVSPEEKLEQRFLSLRHRRANEEVLPLLRSGVGAMASLLKEGGGWDEINARLYYYWRETRRKLVWEWGEQSIIEGDFMKQFISPPPTLSP